MASSQLIFAAIASSLLLQLVASIPYDPNSDSIFERVSYERLSVIPDNPTSRGDRFALAFMNNHNLGVTSQHELGLFVTTEEDSTMFTLTTMFEGVTSDGFNWEPVPGSNPQLYSRTETATRGDFVYVPLPSGRRITGTITNQPDIAVQTNGEDQIADRTKGVTVEAQGNHSLTIYVLSDETVSTDASMPVACSTFPTRGYRYYIFSSGSEGVEGDLQSRFVFTPCQDNTQVTIIPSQQLSSPTWVTTTGVLGTTQVGGEITYRRFNRYESVMISTSGDLTGTIVVSDRPLGMYSGHQCGTPTSDETCDYMVEAIPPHPSHGFLFFALPFEIRQSGQVFRIGTVNNDVTVMINCECVPLVHTTVPPLLRTMTPEGPGRYSAVISVGQYVECLTPLNQKTYCCFQSDKPITVAGYTPGRTRDNLSNHPLVPATAIGDPAMYYIPPATSYLNSYGLSTAKNLTTSFSTFISYVLPTTIFDNSEADRRRFLVNQEPYTPDTDYSPISCRDGSEDVVCAYGAGGFLERQNFRIDYQDVGDGAFWGFVHGFAQEVSFAYPLPFELEPIGMPWITATNQIILEPTSGQTGVDMRFRRAGVGDPTRIRSRGFANTADIMIDGVRTATPGTDYVAVTGNSAASTNLRWPATARENPNVPVVVNVLADSEMEPPEVIPVLAECSEDCFITSGLFTITVVESTGSCETLTDIPNGRVVHSHTTDLLDPPHPFGSTATYICDDGFALVGNVMRTCNGGTWTGSEPSCSSGGVQFMFGAASYDFSEAAGTGSITITATMAPAVDVQLNIAGGPNTQPLIVNSLPGISDTITFPMGQTSFTYNFAITNDNIGLEDVESIIASLSLGAGVDPAQFSVGGPSSTTIRAIDDDVPVVSVAQPEYSVQESDGSVEITYISSVEAVRPIEFSVENDDITATGGGVDYDSSGYSVIIPAGSTSMSAIIAITMDNVPGEIPPETFENTIVSVETDGVLIGQESANVSIIDSTPNVFVMFGSAVFRFPENQPSGVGTIEVITSAPAPVDFSFTIMGGPSMQDFIVNSGGSINTMGSFPQGEQSVFISFPITDDNTALEDLEQYLINLMIVGPPSGVFLGTPSQATVEIVDDDEFVVEAGVDVSVGEGDGAAMVSVRSNRPAARPVTVDVITRDSGSGIGFANGNIDYNNIAAGQVVIQANTQSATFSVDILEDQLLEGPEVFEAVVTGVSDGSVGPDDTAMVTIVDNDSVSVEFSEAVYTFNEGAGMVSVTIVKTGMTVFPIMVNVNGGPSVQTGITVNAEGLGETVTIAPDQTSVEIEFNIDDDDIGLEEIESYIATLTLISPPTGVVLGAIDEAEIRVVDNDEVSVGFGSPMVTVSEESGEYRMCVRLNRPAAVPVTVTLTSMDGSAMAPGDYDPNSVPTELVFEPGSVEECFMGTVNDDGIDGEPPEDFTLIITGVTGGVSISRETTTVVITDTSVVCLELPPLPNGMIAYDPEGSAPYVEFTVATYSCNPGFELDISVGDEERTCRDVGAGNIGEFNGTMPSCVPVCMELDEIDNGDITYSVTGVITFPVGATAMYSCNPGFELSITSGQSQTRNCVENADGTASFDSMAPTCVPMCDSLMEIANGMITYSSVEAETYSVGTTATYTCNDGYQLMIASGQSVVRTCEQLDENSAEFNQMAPTCVAICAELPGIANGMIVYSGSLPAELGSTATYSCDPGYVLNTDNGDEVRTCIDPNNGMGGEFDGNQPVCIPQCDPLPPVDSATITYDRPANPAFDVGTVATYECEDGFTLVGNSMRECQTNRQFSGMEPFCSLIPVCQVLPELVNGVITYSTTERPIPIGTNATHVCNPGFFLVGVVVRECVEDGGTGVFDEDPPTCEPIECAMLAPLANGMITYSTDTTPNYELGTRAIHECDRGFRLVGAQIRTCSDVGALVGEFDLEPPVCEEIICVELPGIANGMISYSAEILTVDTVATYTCVDGFSLIGNLQRTCTTDGVFDGVDPMCTMDPVCEELPPITNGEITYTIDNVPPFDLGTIAMYRCFDGYAINGDNNRTCGLNDMSMPVFDNEAPVCDPVCDELPQPTNGMITYAQPPNPQFQNGTTAVLECEPGFSPRTGPMVIVVPPVITFVCMELLPGEGGVFVIEGEETSPQQLECDPTCASLPDLPNGMITYAEDDVAPYILGTVATHSCDAGFELDTSAGNEMRVCVNNTDEPDSAIFNGSPPECRPVCMPLPDFPNGVISYSPDMMAPYSVGTVATYMCNPGFRFVPGEGDQMRVCREVIEMEGMDATRAMFGGTQPRCEPDDMTTCVVMEPMLVTPFTATTSYTFMGSCEHFLLRSCDGGDFAVRTDFITDTQDNGAVGIFIGDNYWQSNENGILRILDPNFTNLVQVTSTFATNVLTAPSFGVTITHNFAADPASIIVTVNAGSPLGETCGLCGTQNGQLRRADGSFADPADRVQVEAFTMDYLVPADMQALRDIRRECAMLRNDTVIGDPLYSVAISNTNEGDPGYLCYEVRGSANQNYNLISDTCVNVNALYSPMNMPEFGNIMSEIGVRAVGSSEQCYNFRVQRDGCRAFMVADEDGAEMEIDDTFMMDGISVRRYPTRVRISAPNCEEVSLVLWVGCATLGDQEMLHFQVARGVNLRPTSHGLVGQFWNVPVSSAVITDPAVVQDMTDRFYTVSVTPATGSLRSFLAERYLRTWDKRPLQCLYAGNSQGGPYNELQNPSLPMDSVIQGNYREYRVGNLFDSDYVYREFENNRCQ